MFRLVALCAGLLLSLQTFASIGFHQLTMNTANYRALNVAVWYPAADGGKAEKVGDNKVFSGVAAMRDAPPSAGIHPLVAISHGYNGSWRNAVWLAAALAEQGYIVAVVDHPGTTTFNQNPADAQQLWLRPVDVKKVINYLIAHPNAGGRVDESRIAAIGHSLGGWTVMELAGARFDAARFKTDCRQHPNLAGCKLSAKLGVSNQHNYAKLNVSNEDQRVKAVVSLDLGLARGFTPASLAAIDKPVLVMAAQADSPEVSAQLESEYLAAALPRQRVQFVSVAGATHFSFMQSCKPGAEAIINQNAPGEGIICLDGDHSSRAEIHQRLIGQISRFLSKALNYHWQSGDTRPAPSR
ncbi:lipoprotein signal peptide [Izhakiella australiensis]|uniref:Lipoprotein signal peptide n=1 Tax=Izhakiella australiensis TaxID=1926881 RepID=A0A1S8YIH4_9GAMM|nr:alpha/beta fold hydrolase [Izhakiella australiensis]OON38879.1 lipoprotein signal peptide [Izhakiella australiensis]